MKLVALPAFADNYIWMLHDGRQAVVVDPGDAAPVLAALQAQGLALAGILVTHHHPDHVGGIAALRPLLQPPDAGQPAGQTACHVWGPAREAIPQPFTPLAGGDTVTVLGRTLQVIDVPGHTAGHIAFYAPADDGEAPLLFCGDTLFSGGCGRLFEGTPAQMHASLAALAALPGDTRVCCAHEYTESNLKFALAVEPGNAELVDYAAACRALRAGGQPTLPSTIARERAVNPFMRCDAAAVVDAALAQGAADRSGPAVLGALRAWKNQFR